MPTDKKKESAAQREKRLAAALRANLRRRKAQTRDKAQAAAGTTQNSPGPEWNAKKS